MSVRAQSYMEKHSKRSFSPALTGLVKKTRGVGQKEEERRSLQQTIERKAAKYSDLSEVPPVVHEVLNSPGQPLDPATRALMEPRLGHDFSQVRVHADSKAADSARAVHALAYTVGNEVAFGSEQYAPETSKGQLLLSHELTHVVQQPTPKTKSPLGVTHHSDRSEKEAEEVGRAIFKGESISIAPQGQFMGVLARKTEEAMPKKGTKALKTAELPEYTPTPEEMIAEEDKIVNNFYLKVLRPMYDALTALREEPPSAQVASNLIWQARGYLDSSIAWEKLDNDVFSIVYEISNNLQEISNMLDALTAGTVMPASEKTKEVANVLGIYYSSASDDYRYLAQRFFSRYGFKKKK